MGIFQKAEDTRSGLKILGYGKTSTGKTIFALSFPDIAAIDSEDGMAFYKKKYKNLLFIAPTTSAEDIEEALEEIEDDYMDEIKTFVVDSETKIYENLQHGALNVAEKRARKKNQDIDDANLSQREWGKIKLINKRIQATKIMLASKGINIVSIAQEKDKKEKKGENWVVVGHEPDVPKGFEYDYDIVLRFMTKKNEEGKEIYFAEVKKDRTQKYQKGDMIENVSFINWSDIYNEKKDLKESIINFKKDIIKDENNMELEIEKAEKLVEEIKTHLKSFKTDKEKGSKSKKKMDELEIGIKNMANSEISKLTELLEFIKVL